MPYEIQPFLAKACKSVLNMDSFNIKYILLY